MKLHNFRKGEENDDDKEKFRLVLELEVKEHFKFFVFSTFIGLRQIKEVKERISRINFLISNFHRNQLSFSYLQESKFLEGYHQI